MSVRQCEEGAKPLATAWRIEPDANDERAYAALAADIVWNGYSIGDLAPPFRAHARIALAERGEAAAACLLLCHPQFTSVIPAGDPAGVAALLAAVELPAAAFVLLRPEHREAFEEHYTFTSEPQPMLRMGLADADFHPAPGWERLAARLTLDDAPDLATLYAAYPASAFVADTFAVGPCYGVRMDDALVAAAGTHAYAPRYGVAAIGNVFTLPAQRGRGYASAVSSAVVTDLLVRGCRTVVLNVAEANTPARAIYARLGFRAQCAYLEGTVRRRA